VAENAMRMRRRLSESMARVVAELARFTHEEKFELLTRLEAELGKELPL
jgi:hypothetical protein